MNVDSIITAAIALGALSATSEAVGILGLGSDTPLYRFESDSPGTVVQIGASGSFSNIVDIDFHGANWLLSEISGVPARPSSSTHRPARKVW